MHYRVQMSVRLANAIPVVGDVDAGGDKPSDVTGYVIVMGVNACDLATAVQEAQKVALNPKRPDGTFDHYGGVVAEADVTEIKRNSWEPSILKHAVNIDHPGVYYATGLLFFSHADEEGRKKWWQFWK